MTWSDIVSEWYVPMIRNLHTSRVVSRHDRHDRSASRIAITTKTSIVERALGAWRTLHGPDDKVGAVRIVPVWRALSEMSGVDCHARHAYNPLLTKLSAARGGPIRGDAPAPLVHHDDHVDERLATKPGGYDCTHLSPDALLFVTQALFHALLDAPAGRRGRRWRAGV